MIRRSPNRTNKLTSNTRGFSLLEAIIIVMIFAVVGIIAVLVVMRIQNTDKTTTNQNSNNTSQQPQTKEPTLDPEVYASYHSTLGGFTMSYPKSWIVEGKRGGTTTTALDGTEEQLHFQVAPNASKINNYGGNLRITADPPGDEAWPIYPSGTLSDTYRNGMSLWRDNQSQVLKDGRKANTCPSLRIASKTDSAFGYKLKNGKYISFIGSFCWTPGLSTTYSYGQQTESDEFSKTADMIRSIKQD